MTRSISSLLMLVFAFFVFASPSVNAKILPRYKNTGKTISRSSSQTKSIGIFPKLRSDRNALIVTFTNLTLANNVSFTLTYQTDGKEEGAGGSTDTGSGSVTREILFGTCSTGVCRYHTNITNMRFAVTTELKSGKKTTRWFKIKV